MEYLLLKAHGHVVVCDEGDVSVSGTPLQTDYFKNTFSLLKQYQCLLKVVSLNEIVGSISQLSQNDWNFILIDLDLLIVHLVEGITFLGTNLVSRFRLFVWTLIGCSTTGLFHW